MVQGIGEETVSLLDECNDPAGYREFACRVHHADEEEVGLRDNMLSPDEGIRKSVPGKEER